ncbi:TetR/AcrR family transcriptional regulator [Kribbella antibiotica]|uniref:TetR/AcrR family transcriptional regulator n=1 Tax=Kribbella antibiotica TaxID=190195 RepID=A0A4R4ZW94_9ACTN|nr:TetR/AcrR family transcriptional regulator [Kribbella antibiotica]TDD63195.1 TetR/AcrR family transcriptional regulator [Kribbella antibiotica]
MTNDTASTDRARPVRERLIDCASELFYAEGIRAISADRIIAGVGTTKATFYRHFPTKDDLVLAYLQGKADWERTHISAAADTPDARDALRGVVGVLANSSCQPGFRGCPFINAGAEYADVTHPVRRLVADQRQWWTGFFRGLAVRLGVPEGEPADSAAAQIMMLRDGALVAGYLDDPAHVENSLTKAISAVVAAP